MVIALTASAGASCGPAPTGFVTRQGSRLLVAGGPFRAAGTNLYSLMYSSPAQIDRALGAAADTHLGVVRSWAFLDVVNPNDAGHGVFFQSYDADLRRPVVNLGPSGMAHLDAVVAGAKAHGLRLVLTLTNNWGDFGGMDKYVDWLNRAQGVPQHHRSFYTDSTIRTWFKTYVRTVLERVNPQTGIAYRDDPTIFAWELANEPRCPDCADTDGDGRPGPGQVTAWADDMSRFIRSIDPHHLISVGDEGFDCTRRTPEYPYSCAEGVDNEALSALPEVDLVSAHLYSDVEHGYWFGADATATQISDGTTWVEHHADRADRLGKAMLLGEYGRSCYEQGAGRTCVERTDAYDQWQTEVEAEGVDVALSWQFNASVDGAADPDPWEAYTAFCPADALCPALRAHADRMD